LLEFVDANLDKYMIVSELLRTDHRHLTSDRINFMLYRHFTIRKYDVLLVYPHDTYTLRA